MYVALCKKTKNKKQKNIKTNKNQENKIKNKKQKNIKQTKTKKIK